MNRLVALITLAALCASLATASARAQVNGSGPAAVTSNISEQYQPAFTAVHNASMLPPVVGKVISYNDNRLVMDMTDGTVRTFFVAPTTPSGENLLTKGKRLAVTADTNGKAALVNLADQTATATVVSVTKAGVGFKLDNGHTFVLSPQALASMHANVNVTPGMKVTFTTHDGGYTSSISGG